MNKCLKSALAGAVGVSLYLGATGVHAESGITLNGFLTAGATYADHDVGTQDGNITNDVGFSNDSRIGIQISAKVNKQIDITGQLLARGNTDGFDMEADWAFLTYHLSDPLSFRAGKVKLTTFLISDYIEVGYAYPWIRPPQEVYSANPISTINGADLLYNTSFGPFDVLIQPYVGQSQGAQALVPQEVVAFVPTITILNPGPPPTFQLGSSAPGTVIYSDFTANNMAGINMSLGTDNVTVRAGWLRTDVDAADFGVAGDRAEFASVGLTLDWANIVVYSEYFEREIEGRANLAFPNQKGYYGTLGYRIGKFLPHVTFAKLEDNDNPVANFLNPANENGVPLEQESITVGLRYELGSGAALKIEGQRIDPDGGITGFTEARGLLISDPNNPSLKDPSETVSIYGIAIDVVF